ncbi:reverse transcriptase domain-containing protein [Tanacetum coccineum]
MHLWRGRRNVPRLCGHHERNQGMSRQSKGSDKAIVPKNTEGGIKPQWKAGKPEQILTQVCREVTTFFKTLKAFQDMMQCITELPMVTAPRPKEELIIYLCAAREVVSTVVLTERDSQQMPVYFVSRALQNPEVNYNSLKKISASPSACLKKAEKLFPSTFNNIHY